MYSIQALAEMFAALTEAQQEELIDFATSLQASESPPPAETETTPQVPQ